MVKIFGMVHIGISSSQKLAKVPYNRRYLLINVKTDIKQKFLDVLRQLLILLFIISSCALVYALNSSHLRKTMRRWNLTLCSIMLISLTIRDPVVNMRVELENPKLYYGS